MNTTTSKKDFFYLIVLILTFITVLIGATFAVYSLIFSHNEGEAEVYTGTFAIQYLSGDIINCNLLKPIDEVDLEDDSNVYKNNFKVTNTGSLDGLLQIFLDIKENEFADVDPMYIDQVTLMYSIYDEEELLKEGLLLASSGEVAITEYIELAHDTTKSFTLVIWLQETGELQKEAMRKTLVGRIRAELRQKEEISQKKG